jgi:pyruvate formate lyase activating enzyme
MNDSILNATGIITHIQRFSVHDGPGIRTTVFFKGCGNACGWCHNPETLKPQPQIQWSPDKCIGCGRCVAACATHAHEMTDEGHRYLRHLCEACGACADECFTDALTLVGKTMTAEETFKVIVQDRIYYEESEGGVTLSGGEPVLQVEFAVALLKRCRDAGIHSAIETAGNVSWDRIARLLPHLDLVMYDLKLDSAELHRRHIGNDGSRIRENLIRLLETGIPVIVRTPVVGGVNDSVEEIGAIARRLAGQSSLLYYELLAYHPLGGGKYESLGMEKPTGYFPPAREKMRELSEIAGQYVKNVKF